MHSDYECQIMDNKMLGGSLQTQDDLFFCIGTCFHKAKSLHNTRTVFNYEMTNYVLNTQPYEFADVDSNLQFCGRDMLRMNRLVT